MVEVLSRYWWAFVARGVLAILFSILAYAWPRLTSATLGVLFGAYITIDGILLIVKATADWNGSEGRWLLMLEGFLGIGIGIMTLVSPSVTTIALVLCITAWGLGRGVLEIVTAIRLREEIEGESWMMVSGIASILFSVLLMLFAGAGALGLLWLIAAYTIISGVVLIVLGFRLRGHRSPRWNCRNSDAR